MIDHPETAHNDTRKKLWATALAALGLALLVWQLWPHHRGHSGLGKAFFSDDDGKTWFVDEASRVAPFDHNGRTAYRAQVYRCPKQGEFVAHLEYYPPDAKAKLEKAIADGQAPEAILTLQVANPPFVKKPGDARWADPKSDEKYQRVMTPVCPDGSINGLELIDPND